MKKGTHLI